MRSQYYTYEVKVQNKFRRKDLLTELFDNPRISVNPAFKNESILMRAQVDDFEKIEPLFRGLEITRSEIRNRLREGLEVILNIQEDPDEFFEN